jgi:hypothetical protein
MRLVLTALCLGIYGSMVAAQPKNEDKHPNDSAWSSGRTVLPDNKGQLQPQGYRTATKRAAHRPRSGAWSLSGA